jgi:hypothetical protein
VRRLEEMNAKWDQEAKTWTIPHDQEGELRRLLADVGRPVEWKGETGEAEAA